MLLADAEYVVEQNNLSGDFGSDLVIVSIDPNERAVDERVRRVALTSRYDGNGNAIRIGDAILIAANRSSEVRDDEEYYLSDALPLFVFAEQTSTIISVDLLTATPIGETHLDGDYQIRNLFLIDEATARFGFETYYPAAFTFRRGYAFAHADDTGLFVTDYHLQSVNWRDFEVNAESLIAQTSDKRIDR